MAPVHLIGKADRENVPAVVKVRVVAVRIDDPSPIVGIAADEGRAGKADAIVVGRLKDAHFVISVLSGFGMGNVRARVPRFKRRLSIMVENVLTRARALRKPIGGVLMFGLCQCLILKVGDLCIYSYVNNGARLFNGPHLGIVLGPPSWMMVREDDGWINRAEAHSERRCLSV